MTVGEQTGPDQSNHPSEVVTPALLRDWPLPTTETDSKNSRGRVLIVGGSRVTPGGTVLAGLAALRVGAGVVTLGVARSVASPLAVATPEFGVIGLAENDEGSVIGSGVGALEDTLGAVDAILIGPGLDDPAETTALLETAIPLIGGDIPVVLDAYALGVLADVAIVDRLAGRLVLTPNLEEAGRLAGREIAGERLAEGVAEIAQKYCAVVSCQTNICHSDGRRWQTSAGGPGLGTAGSGDVLAGAITGLLARGADPAQAACWATHLHGSAGDRLAAQVGKVGFLAREIVAQLPAVLSELG